MRVKGIFLACLVLIISQKIHAQTDSNVTDYNVTNVTIDPDVSLTQYWAMPTMTNPAATGNIDYIRIRGGARMEWLGSHQSPKNYFGAADAPFKVFGKRIGTGIIVNSNSFFLYRNLLVGAQGSYKFNIKGHTLSVGLQLGYFHTKFKGSELPLYNNNQNPEEGDTPPDLTRRLRGSREGEDEPGNEGEPGEIPGDDGDDSYPWDSEFPTHDVSGGAFDASVGVRFEHPKFYVGVSALHLTNPKIRLKRKEETTTELRYLECKVPTTIYFDAGGNIAINNSLFTLQPSLLLASDFSDFRGIAEMRATYNNKFTFGVDYRWNRAAGVVAGLMIKNFYLGYSWEYDYSASPKGSTGNHELVLGYQFKMDLGTKSSFSQRSIRIM